MLDKVLRKLKLGKSQADWAEFVNWSQSIQIHKGRKILNYKNWICIPLIILIFILLLQRLYWILKIWKFEINKITVPIKNSGRIVTWVQNTRFVCVCGRAYHLGVMQFSFQLIFDKSKQCATNSANQQRVIDYFYNFKAPLYLIQSFEKKTKFISSHQFQIQRNKTA